MKLKIFFVLIMLHITATNHCMLTPTPEPEWPNELSLYCALLTNNPYSYSCVCWRLYKFITLENALLFFHDFIAQNKYDYSLINKKLYDFNILQATLKQYRKCFTTKEHIRLIIKAAQNNNSQLINKELQYAALYQHPHIKIIRYFISNDSSVFADIKKFEQTLIANPQAAYPENIVALIMNIYKGDETCLAQYKKNYLQLPHQCENELTPLCVAADCNHTKTALLFLEQNPKLLNMRPSFTPQCEKLSLLRPIDIAIEKKYSEMCDLFFSYPQIDFNSTINGLTLLELVCKRNNLEIFKSALQSLKKNLPHQYKRFFTANAFELALRNEDIALLFLQEVDYIFTTKEQPLHSAVKCNNEEIIKTICKHPNTNINAKDSHGSTPLITATIKDNDRAIEILLANNADREITNNHNKKAIDYAKNESTKKLLLNKTYIL